MNLKVGISGFGRIGRGIFRNNYEESDLNKKFDVVAIKDIISLEQIAYLLKFDSTYGNFKGDVGVDKDFLIVDGKKIPYLSQTSTADISWQSYGLGILIESSGSVSSGEEVKNLIKGSLKNVIFTRGAQGIDLTMIMGINHHQYNPKQHHILSGGTCTGNAAIPLVYILDKHYGIENGNITTIHPVLSDQKLADVAHPKFSLGRNANSSIIPTQTKIVDSITDIFPELKERLSGTSYRVPTSIVSVIDATFYLKKGIQKEGFINLLKQYEKGSLEGIINCDEGYLGHSKVTIDFLGSPYSAIIPLNEIRVVGDKMVSLSIIHDNEKGYCYRIKDLINYVYERNISYE